MKDWEQEGDLYKARAVNAETASSEWKGKYEKMKDKMQKLASED
jgi:hypothetical protein